MSESMPEGLPAPDRLGPRGLSLWQSVTAGVDLSRKPADVEVLIEACRCADRLEQLDRILSGDPETWCRFDLPKGDGDELVLIVSGPLAEARQQQNIFKQLIASLRLPDELGQVPQRRGTPRGAHQPKGSGRSTVSSLDRARQRAKTGT